MCGIIGGIYNEEIKNNLESYFDILSHRGEDSYGVIFIQDKITPMKNLHLAKGTYQEKTFVKKAWRYVTKTIQKGIIDDIKKIPVNGTFIAHNRAASIGGVNLKLAHPITKSNVSVIHNGTKKKLKEFFSDLGESDTEVIASILSVHFYADILTKTAFNGAGVIFGVHNKKVFVHIDGERPLFINKDRSLIASEPITPGKWYLIKEQHTIYPSFEKFLKTTSIYKNGVDVDEYDLIGESICPACSKRHLLSSKDKDGRCFRCIVKNEKVTYSHYQKTSYQTATYNYQPTKKFIIGATVEGITWRGDYVIGNVADIYASTVEVECSDGSKEYLEKDAVEPIDATLLNEGENYNFTDTGEIWYKKKFHSIYTVNNYYRYYTQESKNSSLIPYKFVKLSKKQLEKVEKEVCRKC